MNAARGYHETTKHSFNRFAPSLGYLDWAAQPDPFRRFSGAPLSELPRAPLRPEVPFQALFGGAVPASPMDLAGVGEFLRCSMGLSAWKQYQTTRWALRVNPSSGNLHPTEAYVLWNGRLCHYAPRAHALEVRAVFDAGAGDSSSLVVGLTSILWREAWKYGERAFRYCQHDIGHAIGALRCAAALLGWQLAVLDDCTHEQLATLLGVDRESDFADAEREEPECLLMVTAGPTSRPLDIAAMVHAATDAVWLGRANTLSRSHVEWPGIEDVARATRKQAGPVESRVVAPSHQPDEVVVSAGPSLSAREIILRRRSALGFDGSSFLPRSRFAEMLRSVTPGRPPLDAIAWSPQVHLALFVHRVEGVLPGLYMYLRDPSALDALRAAMRPDFLWEAMHDSGSDEPSLHNLFLLVPADVRFTANRLSCDQDIAADGFFSLGMLARFETPLREQGEWFYRRLFWECGLIGQALYLQAEAAEARATGIGCFYDDPVHEVLGLTDEAWQSLYHFSVGVPVDDGRLLSEPGYPGGW